jgi:hypothetical protein
MIKVSLRGFAHHAQACTRQLRVINVGISLQFETIYVSSSMPARRLSLAQGLGTAGRVCRGSILVKFWIKPLIDRRSYLVIDRLEQLTLFFTAVGVHMYSTLASRMSSTSSRGIAALIACLSKLR